MISTCIKWLGLNREQVIDRNTHTTTENNGAPKKGTLEELQKIKKVQLKDKRKKILSSKK